MTKFGPKSDLSPSLGQSCPLCHGRFAIGDYTTLMRATRDGRYANDGVEVHWDCATGKMPALQRPASGTGQSEATTTAARPITGKRQ